VQLKALELKEKAAGLVRIGGGRVARSELSQYSQSARVRRFLFINLIFIGLSR